VDAFPLVKRILEKITGSESPYLSPTDMGVNRAGFSIVDDNIAQDAAKQEIVRRFLRYSCEYMMGLVDKETVQRSELKMDELRLKVEDRSVVIPARKAAEQARLEGKQNEGISCGAAIELPDGSIVTGINSTLMHSAAAAVLNAIKHLAEIPDKIHLIAPTIIESIASMKKVMRNGKGISLDVEEALIAVGSSTPSNSLSQLAIDQLKHLRGCEMHMTHIPTPGDEAGLRALGVNLTSDPQFSSQSLFVV
jgi:uncharacterized protein (UPF0371 family)